MKVKESEIMPAEVKSKWKEYKEKFESLCVAQSGKTDIKELFEEKYENRSIVFYLSYNGRDKVEKVNYQNKRDNIFYSRVEKNDQLQSEELKTINDIENIEEKLEARGEYPRCTLF